MRIEKLICDECGKEKDLLQMQFGGTDDWQSILVNDLHNNHNRIKKDFCCMDCVVSCYMKNKHLP
jgi:hypothetical protein